MSEEKTTPATEPETSKKADEVTPEALKEAFGGKEVAVKDENALVFTEEEQAIQAQLKEGSGENESGGWAFIPYITVNNKMVERKLDDGTDVKVRCAPDFNITEKDDDGNYVATLFAPEFEGVILKFMHRVQRKVEMDQNKKVINSMPFFRSLEFKSFRDDVHIRVTEDGKGRFEKPMSYQEVKKWAKEESELWSIVYFVIPGEDFVRKAEFKGMSRSVLFDYMTKKRPYSVSSVITKFSTKLDKESANPYNVLVIENTMKKPENLAQILEMQKELNAMIDSNLEPTVQAEQLEALPSPEDKPEPNFNEPIEIDADKAF